MIDSENKTKIVTRQARVVATKGREPTLKNLPPMTREAWEAMPASFKHFHPWEAASKPLTIRVDNTYQGQA
jgi:hypothetical protein